MHPIQLPSNPLPPMPHNLPAGYVPEPPRKNRIGKVVVSILALLVLAGGGFAAYWLNQQQTASPPSVRFAEGDLHAGNYWLVNACNVFTAKDFDDITGKRTDHSAVTTDFAVKTYNETQAGRSYRTSCGRGEAPSATGERLFVDVIIQQYPDDRRTNDQLLEFGLGDAQYDQELGGRTAFTMPKLGFESGNKLISVAVQGYGEMTRDQVSFKLRSIAQKVAQKLRGPDQKALGALHYPAKLEASSFTYQNACVLWGPNDFTALYGPADEAAIKMDFAEDIIAEEEVRGIDRSTKTTCVIGSHTVDPADLKSKDYAYIEVDYFRSKEAADTAYNTYTRSDDERVEDIGEAAVLQQKQRLMVRSANKLIRVQYIPNELSEKAKAEEGVCMMARTILDRLD